MSDPVQYKKEPRGVQMTFVGRHKLDGSGPNSGQQTISHVHANLPEAATATETQTAKKGDMSHD